jgi:beta-phosphoglucomutase-like phosphatase (HAD superfamily)
MTTKTLLIDIDEVVLGWFDAYRDFVQLETGRMLPDRSTEYHLFECFGLTESENKRLFTQFNNNEPAFGQLKPIRDAEKVLPKFHQHGWTIIGITASSNAPSSVLRRNLNLIDVFGDIFSSIICVNHGYEKKAYLEQFSPAVWVEDRIENAQYGYDAGHFTIVMNQSHNEQHKDTNPHLCWVYDWNEIYTMLIEEK